MCVRECVDNGVVEGGGWSRGCVRESVDNGVVEGGGWRVE